MKGEIYRWVVLATLLALMQINVHFLDKRVEELTKIAHTQQETIGYLTRFADTQNDINNGFIKGLNGHTDSINSLATSITLLAKR